MSRSAHQSLGGSHLGWLHSSRVARAQRYWLARARGRASPLHTRLWQHLPVLVALFNALQAGALAPRRRRVRHSMASRLWRTTAAAWASACSRGAARLDRALASGYAGRAGTLCRLRRAGTLCRLRRARSRTNARGVEAAEARAHSVAAGCDMGVLMDEPVEIRRGIGGALQIGELPGVLYNRTE
jgi:hypothetical protein